MGTRINIGGFVIAGIGFFLTRFTVTLALYDDPVRFYLAGVLPLALGLGLAAFGVALVVADVDASMVRTTALWCVLGTGAMFVLVVLTLLGSSSGSLSEFLTLQSRASLSNFLIGGSVGGTLTGLYASRNQRQQQTLRQQTHRLEVLNRLLRHEVLNSVAVIQGFTSLDRDDPRSETAIPKHAQKIQDTIEEVKYLTQSAGATTTTRTAIPLAECLRDTIASVSEAHPDARLSMGSVPESLQVQANERLELVMRHLLENAVVHATTAEPEVSVSVTTTATRAAITVTDNGSGLPENQQQLLETGEIEEFDDPTTGFGLNVVRLLVESYDGAIDTEVQDSGTSITVSLARADTGELGPSGTELRGFRPATTHLSVIVGAAVVAGIIYGLISTVLGGSIAAIGVLYGINDPVVGWVTHEFHSVVFGFVFAGFVSVSPERYRNRVTTYVGIGAAWGLVLWAGAAGVIAPLWLQLLGIPAPIPNISTTSLVPHLVWGVSLGAMTAWGYRHAIPWVRRRTDSRQ